MQILIMNLENEIYLLKREIVADKELLADHSKQLNKRITELEDTVFELEQKCEWVESRMWRYDKMLKELHEDWQKKNNPKNKPSTSNLS